MTPDRQSARMRDICALAPVIPVIVIDDIAHAQPLARALVAGGLPVLEVTLRTPVALDAIRAMSTVPGAVVGAGTVLSADDIHRARNAGATFAVAPGMTDSLIGTCETCALPMLPGAATASEAMQALEMGFDMLKFFPAGPAGGPSYLKALGGPLPGIGFCPTGGVSVENARDYLALPNVGCVGGTWLTPADALASGDWARIEKLASEAAALK